MTLFNPEKMKIGKPVKKTFMGGDLFILPGLNAAQGIQFSNDMRAIDIEQEGYFLRVAAAHIRARVVDSEGGALFAELSTDELMVEYDADLIDELYGVVISVTGDPYAAPKDAEKNS